MPNLNDENLAPVSFRKGGFTHGGQVHIDGTYAYLPKDIAEWDEDRQVQELGDVYWSQGIRRGFLPASETYLAGEYQRRISKDLEDSDQARREAANVDGVPVVAPAGSAVETDDQGNPVRIVTGGPTGEVRELSEAEITTLKQPGILRGGVDPHTGDVPSGYTLQNPQGPATDEGEGSGNTSAVAEGGSGTEAAPLPRNPETGDVPVHTELSTATTDESLTPSEQERADANREAQKAEPFEGASSANIEQTRSYLGTASEDDVNTFIEWELSRTDRTPRKSLLQELGVEDDRIQAALSGDQGDGAEE